MLSQPFGKAPFVFYMDIVSTSGVIKNTYTLKKGISIIIYQDSPVCKNPLRDTLGLSLNQISNIIESNHLIQQLN